MIVNLSKVFELVLFTASKKTYANEVIKLLDPEGKYFSLRLFREHCHMTKEEICMKDLRILKGRDPKNMIIVDNSIYCYGFNLNNGIPILPFYGDFEDTQLRELESFLFQAMKFNDMRSIVSKVFRYDLYKKHIDHENILIKELITESAKLQGEFITLL